MLSNDSAIAYFNRKLPGSRRGTFWGVLAGVLVAIIISLVSLSYLFSLENRELQASKLEWGLPHESVITRSSALVQSSHQESTSQVTVRYSPDTSPINVVMAQSDSEWLINRPPPVTNVWVNARTGESFVDKDIRHSFTEHEPYQTGDHTEWWFWTIIGMFLSVALLGKFGRAQQDVYEKKIQGTFPTPTT